MGQEAFIKGEEEFTVNIALIKDEQPILGIVQALLRVKVLLL